jgi:homoserine/homoserine lactone efflux protein
VAAPVHPGPRQPELANPKSILFWGALFPQFVDYHSGDVVVQFAILAATGIAVDIIILSAYGAAAARGGRLLASGPAAVWRERLSGAALVIVGGALSLAG